MLREAHFAFIIIILQQGMGLLHCATQNSHIHVMNFIFQSLENLDINVIEKVGVFTSGMRQSKTVAIDECDNLQSNILFLADVDPLS